ncbi:hypothetical protein ASPZODRAFT_132107 [Penicilliopsis zonata CBS 506.65]|uniref:PH domain-containing protein n=1 Tax=Penicilliopsis zonata CBS 506.65 TaxID=1073090 RepID=A0A1L9SIU6_9EURO|nr:hypothetical protein ASPZODRAFT_132107 [Penicilliopsis zonata CBS 506.65]OJJ47152.1 hypothetical protein ASPZODRAFT_132107 [Penicilliopsis zonata CBS 506.65]
METESNPSSSSSVSQRRGPRLAPLQTNFSRPGPRSSQRPRPSEYPSAGEPVDRVPLHARPVKTQSSKTGLRGLFGRDKSSRKSAATEETLAEIDAGQPRDTPDVSHILSPVDCATPKTAVSVSTAILSPPLPLPLPPPPPPPPPEEQQQHREQQQKLRPPRTRSKSRGDKTPAGEMGWKPPPLFQAYPQAFKHDFLWAPTLNLESVLRSLQNDESGDKKKKEGKENGKHDRTPSGSKIGWAQKIYVLATSGYILQYAGDGKHDRLPEKMMQLGPESVAFASDAIPGKHYVLQISQSSTDDVTTVLDGSSKPLLSRFGFHRTPSRRLVRSFLLVFATADKMNSWLEAIRAEIEARGGRKYVSDKSPGGMAESSSSQLPPSLQSKPSLRQIVVKDPNQFPAPNNTTMQADGMIDPLSRTSTARSRRSSYQSVDRRSWSLPPDQPRLISELAHLANNNNNNNNIDSNVRKPSWPSPSGPGPLVPTNTMDHVPESPPEDSPLSPPPSQSQRMSVMYQRPPSVMNGSARPSRPQSVYPEALAARSTSPPAPNFSVPSFSRKFSLWADQTLPPIPHPTGSSSPPGHIHDEANRRRSQVVLEEPEEDVERSIIGSPPLSPCRSVSSLGRELPATWTENSARRPLRVSNSEDSLGGESQKRAHNVSARVALDMESLDSIAGARFTPAPPLSSSQPRPYSMVFRTPRPHPTINNSSSNNTTTTNSNIPIPNGSEQGSPSSPPLMRAVSPPQGGMARRKSMPGFTSIGPPAAPPPNCPLPQLPPDVVSRPGAASPSRFYKPASPQFSPALAGTGGTIPPDLMQRMQSPSPPRHTSLVNHV